MDYWYFVNDFLWMESEEMLLERLILAANAAAVGLKVNRRLHVKLQRRGCSKCHVVFTQKLSTHSAQAQCQTFSRDVDILHKLAQSPWTSVKTPQEIRANQCI